MIRSFRSKPLSELWSGGASKKIDARLTARILRRLDFLDRAKTPEAMNIPGFNFHPLKGQKPTRYTIHINGPWCVTFEFEKGDAVRVDLEQYH
jgi:proteic killer suppression protein